MGHTGSPKDNGHRGGADPPAPCDQPMQPLVMEFSWEVCAQAGGIYTVLRSKAPAAVQRRGDCYALMGPYHEAAARVEFEPQAIKGPLGDAVNELRKRG